MNRISVIGCPGAGKTTFSQELAHITRLPLTHLDLIYHDQAYSYQTDRDSWRTRVRKETAKKQWIIDGNYKSTFDIRLPVSDMIIFLDYPTHLSIVRAIKRRIEYRKAVRVDMPPTWKEQLGWKFFMHILKFNHSIAPQIRKQLNEYPGAKVEVLKNPRHANEFLESLSHGR